MQHRRFEEFWSGEFFLACACGWETQRFLGYSQVAYRHFDEHVRAAKRDEKEVKAGDA